MHGIPKLTGLKNYDNLTTEDLIFSLLKSESNPAERNYIKYFNNSTNDEIKSKINNIRIILKRLGNILTKNDRKKIKTDLYKIEKKNNLSANEKKGFTVILLSWQILSMKKKNTNIVIMII